MAGIRVYIDGDRAGPLFQRAVTRQKARVLESARDAAQDTADEILDEGRADIKGAGNFGSRWTDGLNAEVTEGGGNIRIAVTEDVEYWKVHQFGAVIHGKPLLWIPLSFASDALGVSAKDYSGQLFRVDRAGKAPLLMTPGKPAKAKYVGKESVTLPKRFHLIEITRAAARRIKDFYRDRFKNSG
jgi:hypothetical protein